MTVSSTLRKLLDVILEEAGRNPAFSERLGAVLNPSGDLTRPSSGRSTARRTMAVLDPIELARIGEGELRTRLSALNLEQLRDVVAQYGMDPRRLVMKWKDEARVRERIVEVAIQRSRKGEVFSSKYLQATASGRAFRRGSRRSRGRLFCRASRPPHTSPEAGRGDICCRRGRHTAPASPRGRYPNR